MTVSEFIFDSVDLLHYNLQKTSLNRQHTSILLKGCKIKSNNKSKKIIAIIAFSML